MYIISIIFTVYIYAALKYNDLSFARNYDSELLGNKQLRDRVDREKTIKEKNKYFSNKMHAL